MRTNEQRLSGRVPRPARALLQAEETLKLALDAGELGTFDVDLLDGRVAWDERTCRIFGVDPRVRIRTVKQSAELFHPVDRPAALRAFREALVDRSEGIYRVEKRVVRPDGMVRWVSTRGRTYFAELRGRREAVRMVGVVQDVTDRKSVERAFAREARLLSLSHDAVFAWRLSGEIELWNRGAQQLYGFDARQAVGKPRRELVPSWYPEAWESVEELLRGRGRWHGEVRQQARDGHEVVVSSRMQLFVDECGPLVLEVNRDVTDERSAHDALEQANRHKDEFLAMLGHELRNPLAAIASALAVQREVDADDPRRVQAREVIARQATHMKRLIDDLLDVTRVAHGKIELRKEPMDLARLVRTVAQDHAIALERAGLELELDAPLRPVLVEGDEVRLAQVVGNLLTNAGKFTAPCGKVTVCLVIEDDWAVLTVEDTGEGMDEEVQRHLFEPFRQGAHALAGTKGGLGLGLALVHGITTLHGGEVNAFSPGLGCGARFTVRLPLARGASRASTLRPPPAMSARRETLLVVDDSADNAEMLKARLELRGYRVFVAHDAPSALRLAIELRPSVVLSDIDLGGPMNGYDLARTLRSVTACSDTLLIAVSGYARSPDREAARRAGFDEHLAKPADFTELMSLIASHLG